MLKCGGIIGIDVLGEKKHTALLLLKVAGPQDVAKCYNLGLLSSNPWRIVL